MPGHGESLVGRLEAARIDTIQFFINDSFVMEQLVYALTFTDGTQVAFLEGAEDFRQFEEWLERHFPGVYGNVWQWYNVNILPNLDNARTPETTVYTRARGVVPLEEIRAGT
ncbi:MAG: PhzA/PhzB family protein [Armatimonadetes bacterium]|nr:PhzA/PhzB family protein [Armatimonadota bacterium]